MAEEEEAPTKELTAAEIEKRRKKNAKKRAKQKAKKAAASSQLVEDTQTATTANATTSEAAKAAAAPHLVSPEKPTHDPKNQNPSGTDPTQTHVEQAQTQAPETKAAAVVSDNEEDDDVLYADATSPDSDATKHESSTPDRNIPAASQDSNSPGSDIFDRLHRNEKRQEALWTPPRAVTPKPSSPAKTPPPTPEIFDRLYHNEKREETLWQEPELPQLEKRATNVEQTIVPEIFDRLYHNEKREESVWQEPAVLERPSVASAGIAGDQNVPEIFNRLYHNEKRQETVWQEPEHNKHETSFEQGAPEVFEQESVHHNSSEKQEAATDAAVQVLKVQAMQDQALKDKALKQAATQQSQSGSGGGLSSMAAAWTSSKTKVSVTDDTMRPDRISLQKKAATGGLAAMAAKAAADKTNDKQMIMAVDAGNKTNVSSDEIEQGMEEAEKVEQERKEAERREAERFEQERVLLEILAAEKLEKKRLEEEQRLQRESQEAARNNLESSDEAALAHETDGSEQQLKEPQSHEPSDTRNGNDEAGNHADPIERKRCSLNSSWRRHSNRSIGAPDESVPKDLMPHMPGERYIATVKQNSMRKLPEIDLDDNLSDLDDEEHEDPLAGLDPAPETLELHAASSLGPKSESMPQDLQPHSPGEHYVPHSKHATATPGGLATLAEPNNEVEDDDPMPQDLQPHSSGEHYVPHSKNATSTPGGSETLAEPSNGVEYDEEEQARQADEERLKREEEERLELQRLAAAAAKKTLEEEAARIKAEEEEAAQKAAEEAARQKAKEEKRLEQLRLAEESARLKAEEVAAQKAAEEEASRRKAEAEERLEQLRLAKEAARIKAEEEAAQKAAEVEAARQKAEEERLKQEEVERLELLRLAESTSKKSAVAFAPLSDAKDRDAAFNAPLYSQFETPVQKKMTETGSSTANTADTEASTVGALTPMESVDEKLMPSNLSNQFQPSPSLSSSNNERTRELRGGFGSPLPQVSSSVAVANSQDGNGNDKTPEFAMVALKSASRRSVHKHIKETNLEFAEMVASALTKRNSTNDSNLEALRHMNDLKHEVALLEEEEDSTLWAINKLRAELLETFNSGGPMQEEYLLRWILPLHRERDPQTGRLIMSADQVALLQSFSTSEELTMVAGLGMVRSVMQANFKGINGAKCLQDIHDYAHCRLGKKGKRPPSNPWDMLAELFEMAEKDDSTEDIHQRVCNALVQWVVREILGSTRDHVDSRSCFHAIFLVASLKLELQRLAPAALEQAYSQDPTVEMMLESDTSNSEVMVVENPRPFSPRPPIVQKLLETKAFSEDIADDGKPSRANVHAIASFDRNNVDSSSTDDKQRSMREAMLLHDSSRKDMDNSKRPLEERTPETDLPKEVQDGLRVIRCILGPNHPHINVSDCFEAIRLYAGLIVTFNEAQEQLAIADGQTIGSKPTLEEDRLQSLGQVMISKEEVEPPSQIAIQPTEVGRLGTDDDRDAQQEEARRREKERRRQKKRKKREKRQKAQAEGEEAKTSNRAKGQGGKLIQAQLESGRLQQGKSEDSYQTQDWAGQEPVEPAQLDVAALMKENPGVKTLSLPSPPPSGPTKEDLQKSVQMKVQKTAAASEVQSKTRKRLFGRLNRIRIKLLGGPKTKDSKAPAGSYEPILSTSDCMSCMDAENRE